MIILTVLKITMHIVYTKGFFRNKGEELDIREYTHHDKIDELLQDSYLKKDLVLNFGETVSQSRF